MSGPLVPTSGGFQQTGQLDWVALSKSTFSFGLDVLVRLSKAELNPATVAIGLISCNRFVINSEAQKRIYDALSSLNSFSSYGKFIWFGFGVKSVIKDLADSEHGLACVALCACMSISYDSFFAAGVLRELCKIHKTPPDFLPSIHQWKALVDICAGSVSSSKFPVLLEGLIRCVIPNAEVSLHKPTSTEALAKAVGAIADVSNGNLEGVTIAGGLDCLWLAAISEWLLSLDVEVRRSSGFTAYKSSRIDENRSHMVTIIFMSDIEQSIHLSKCHIVPKGHKFWDSPSPEQHTFRGGRSEWKSILSDTFGPSFDTLVQKDTRQGFALLLLEMSHRTREFYQYRSMPVDEWQNFAGCSHPFRRFQFSHSSSKGQAFLAFAAQQLPELAATVDIANQIETQSHISKNLEDRMHNITLICGCQRCFGNKMVHNCDPGPFCLELMAQTIIMFLWMLSATEVDPSLKPSSCGLRLLYLRHQKKSQLAQSIQNKSARWKHVPPVDLATVDIDILSAVLIIFSGSDDTGPTEDGNSSAVSRHGVCAFFGALEDLNLLPEEASTVKVVPGHIDFGGIKYARICDLVDDQAFEGNLGPHPAYNLLVQETRQQDILAAAYKLSCNFQSYGYLLGISRLEMAIAKSIQGPIQCGEFCGRRFPYGTREAIEVVPKGAIRERNLSHLSEGVPPFLRQWSLFSIPRHGTVESIKLRVVQATIYRLYLEIAQQVQSYHLAFLSICRDCQSTLSSLPKFGKEVKSLSSRQYVFSQSGSDGAITVSYPSKTESWIDRAFEIFSVTRSNPEGPELSATDAQNAMQAPPKKGPSKAALHMAAILGREGAVQLLLQGGATVHSTTVGGETALHYAAEEGQNEVVRILVGRGAQLEIKEKDGLTPLSRAAQSGFRSTVDLIIGYGAKQDSRENYGRTPLALAADRGHLAVVERLLQEKADVNTAAAEYGGRTALQAAAGGGYLAVVERLLQEKANVNAASAEYSGRTALQAAAEGGHLTVVKRLLQEKADVNAAAARDSGRTALQAAAGGGHLTVVERLLQEKADVNTTAKYSGRTALQAAAGGGHLAVVERLLQEKANVNAAAAERGGRTALQAAAGGGHLAVVERLLQEKANVNAAAAEYDSGRTALQAAAGGGHLAVVERLLQEKADVNTTAAEYGGRTALQAAAEGGHLAVVERLLQEKADINAASAEYDGGRTALQAAAGGGHLAVVKRLLQEKADVNTASAEYGGRTALQAAAGGGHLAVVKQLLQEKADVNTASAEYGGRTALQAAAGGGHLAVVERLLQEKADVNTASACSGRTALQAAAGGGHLTVVERLLQEKANVNAAAAEYDSGRTALQAAAGGGHLAVVERLLQEKADVNTTAAEYGGRTALQAAAEGGHLAVVERLLQEKADVNAAAARDSGRTALQAAAEGGHLAVVERLLQEKADVNDAAAAEYDGGRTALQAAAGGGHLAVVERLLQEKANVNAAAAYNSGRTALEAAAEGGHLAVVERLLQEKADVNAASARSGRTALQAAAEGGHKTVVECLREAGAIK